MSHKTEFAESVKITQEKLDTTYDFRSDANFNRLIIRGGTFDNQKFLEMQNKIQSLELELENYKNDRRNYDQRIAFEQKRVQDLTSKVNSIKIENSAYLRERSTLEERISVENSKTSDLELRFQDILNENSFLLKKISNLEETVRSERLQMEAYTERFKSSKSTGVGSGKIGSLEDRIRNQQQRIFELEAIIENSNSDSSSLRSSLSSYESTIEHQKIQVDSILKKLQNANADNEFLVKKLALLTQTLRNYQFEIESMSAQLQNAKSIIASLHAELARANGQLAKYQAALSSSYVLNGELMTKVSGFSTMTQYQSTTETKLDILNLNLQKIEASAKSFTYNTPSLLEATGSETYLKYIKQTSSNSVDSENAEFTPYSASETAAVTSDHIESA